MTLPIPQAWLEALAVALDEVEDASREFSLKVSNSVPSSRPNWLISRVTGLGLPAPVQGSRRARFARRCSREDLECFRAASEEKSSKSVH